MPRQHKPKTRRHLAYAQVKVLRWPSGVLSIVPITKTEIRLVNTGKDYRQAKHNTTSRCIRAYEARADHVLKEAISKSALLQGRGLAAALAGRP